MPRELLNMIQTQEPIRFKVIPKRQYHRALQEFVKYGQFMRFPEKLIKKWKEQLLWSISKLEWLTAIHGHTSYFPEDDFHDVFNYNLETDENYNGEYSRWLKQKGYDVESSLHAWTEIYEFLDEVYNIDDVTPQFTNGHHVLSDYGVEPLVKLGRELDGQDSPEEIIVTINKILDVAHQRSDLAELFIEGGSDSLYDISNN